MKKRAREAGLVREDNGAGDYDGSGGAGAHASARAPMASCAELWKMLDFRASNLPVEVRGAGSADSAMAGRHERLRSWNWERPLVGVAGVEIGDSSTSMPVSGYGLRRFEGSGLMAGRWPDGGQFQKSKSVNESERGSKGKAVEERAERGAKMEPKTARDRATELKKPSPLPPAFLLYPASNRQDAQLHSELEKQGSLLGRAELAVRVDAIARMNQLADLIRDRETRKLVMDIILLQFRKEEEVSMVQALVNTLCSAALVPCAEGPDGGDDGDVEPTQEAAGALLLYLSAEEARAAPLKSGLKIQILRSLYQLATAGRRLEYDSLRVLAKEQLSSSNPRLREWGIRLLVQSIQERNGEDLRGVRSGSPETFQKNRAEGDSLMQILMEHTRDPYPNVREAVVWGILELYGKGFELKHNTYKRAVALLSDSFESVRISAIKLVGLCVKAAEWDSLETPRSNYTDNAFLQICNMMTDMIMSVRREACNILADMTGVSDSVLLQSLTKKVLTPPVTEMESAARASRTVSDGDVGVADPEENKVHDWSAAGAFVLGLEDEFWEVRSAAIKALERLGMSSDKIIHGVLELMVDMINDDSHQVRQQTIEALASLAQANRLSIQEDHLHMFAGVMENSNVETRKAGHYLLSVVSFPTIAMFKLIIEAILASLEKRPEDEASLLVTLRKLGQSHSSHTECIARQLVLELKGLLRGAAGLDEPRCACILVLLLGAATVNGKILSLIPSDIISMVSVASGKLPVSLPLLQVLPMGFMALQYAWSERDEILPIEQHCSKQWSMNGPRRWRYQSWEQEILEIAGQIVASAVGTSVLVDIKAFEQCLQKLSQCRKELKAIKQRSLAGSGPVSFYELYLQCLTLMVNLRANVVSPEIRHPVKMRGSQQEILSELNSSVKHLLHRFCGFQQEQLSQVMDLNTFVLVWRLALHPLDFVNSVTSTLPIVELKASVAAAEKLVQEQNLPPSLLLMSVRQQLLPLLSEKNGTKVIDIWRTARLVALSYWPRPILVDSSLKEMWADMKAPGSDFDHPVGFMSGLPLGISVDVTAYNVPKSNSLWVRCIQGISSTARYRLLDVEEEGNKSPVDGVRRLSTLFHLDELPSVAASIFRMCVVLEGADHSSFNRDGDSTRMPKGSFVPLCSERDVHLVLVKGRSGSRPLPPKR